DGNTRFYAVDDAGLAPVMAIHISDTGDSAVVVRPAVSQVAAEVVDTAILRSDRGFTLEFGQLENGRFVGEYQHDLGGDGLVEWMHPDQIVFTGSDGDLYAYDRRNQSISVLLSDIGVFRLSQD